jgi:hypothetical protein
MGRLRTSHVIVACCAALLLLPATASASSFTVTCASDHVANDDPIVFPGRPGASHRHEFFGAKGVTPSSTPRAMRAGSTTCVHRPDTASYWAPSLEVRGRLVRATLHAYYERAGKARAASPPPGLKMISGDMHAMEPQSMRITTWQCRGGRAAPTREVRTVPACRTGQHLAAWVRFPDCWNGRQLDSADHRSHVARSWKGHCPATHPVELMRVALLLTWPVSPRSAGAVTLGGGKLMSTGLHADFWNTWQQSALNALRWKCIEVAANCGEIRSKR